MKKRKIPGGVGAILGVCLGTVLICVSRAELRKPIETEVLPPGTTQLASKVYETEHIPETTVAPVADNPAEPELADTQPEETEPAYTQEELEILAIIIYQEAGADACSDDTRRKVGSVFLNRVNSPLFPDTFQEVATAKRQYGRLSWTGLKWPDRASSPGEAHAVARAYRIAEELLTGGSILPDNVIWQAEFTQGDGIYCQQDGFYFCYSEVDE